MTSQSSKEIEYLEISIDNYVFYNGTNVILNRPIETALVNDAAWWHERLTFEELGINPYEIQEK